MILKLKFIFIMNGLIMDRRIMNRRIMDRRAGQGRARGAGLSLALALAFLLCAVAPAGWAQSQVASDSTQSASTQSAVPTAPAAEDPPSPPIDANADTEAMFPHFKDSRFWLSGQTNFIFQAHPGFHADYSGKNSLSPHYDKATSRVMTLYTGVRLNNSTELLVDIEEAGGAALSTGLGLAGNTDLDIVRNPLLSKVPYLGRGMIHKVFALSKDRIENQRSFLSLFDELPRRPPGNSLRQVQPAGFL